MGPDKTADEFAAKVDAFAATLTPEEQAMLADLVSDAEVAGFSAGWPGIEILAPSWVSSGGGSPKVFRTQGQPFEQTGGGSPKV